MIYRDNKVKYSLLETVKLGREMGRAKPALGRAGPGY
jgi:hypothetical protein